MGDPACFLSGTCLSCGRFLEEPGREQVCPHCGEPLDSEEDLLGAGRPTGVQGDLSTVLESDEAPRVVVRGLDGPQILKTLSGATRHPSGRSS